MASSNNTVRDYLINCILRRFSLENNCCHLFITAESAVNIYLFKEVLQVNKEQLDPFALFICQTTDN